MKEMNELAQNLMNEKQVSRRDFRFSFGINGIQAILNLSFDVGKFAHYQEITP